MTYNLIVDIDGTLCDVTADYENANPKLDVINKVNSAYWLGSYVILYTSRGMRTFNGNVDQIEIHHRPILEKWLSNHNVDDKSITPEDFIGL
jgi:capsule biosynthesis phosphatase